MSGEIIHICCSDSPYGSIKYAIGTGLLDGKKVIGFFDDLSNGPIDKFIELKERINWCKKICGVKKYVLKRITKLLGRSRSIIKNLMMI